MDKDEVQLTAWQWALFRQAPLDWTDVPRFAHVSTNLDELEKKGAIEMRNVDTLTPGLHKKQWRLNPAFERRQNGKVNGND